MPWALIRQLRNIGLKNRVFRCLSRHRCPLVTEINMAGYGDGRSTSSRDALAAIAMWCIDDNLSLLAASTRFRHIYFCHERTTMTSETSEKTIFVQFYFIQCDLMLTSFLWPRLILREFSSVHMQTFSFVLVESCEWKLAIKKYSEWETHSTFKHWIDILPVCILEHSADSVSCFFFFFF